jgi:hypothetical protein
MPTILGGWYKPETMPQIGSSGDYFWVARDPPGIGIRQPSFDFPRHSFGEVIQIDMLS